jgi:hypothetical protein
MCCRGCAGVWRAAGWVIKVFRVLKPPKNPKNTQSGDGCNASAYLSCTVPPLPRTCLLCLSATLVARWGCLRVTCGAPWPPWPRSLVRYTEAHPLFLPEERSSEVAVDGSGTGFRCGRAVSAAKPWGRRRVKESSYSYLCTGVLCIGVYRV